ncbi:hypothetical protein HMPREF9086_3908 [Enterobacter hormaechei ATCC 49162]|nr:hypothetical protein HMPREF9086_3908 [Enterobacter hormaechei ATCC 49162]
MFTFFVSECILALRNIKYHDVEFSYLMREMSVPQNRLLLFFTVHISERVKKEKFQFTKEP